MWLCVVVFVHTIALVDGEQCFLCGMENFQYMPASDHRQSRVDGFYSSLKQIFIGALDSSIWKIFARCCCFEYLYRSYSHLLQ